MPELPEVETIARSLRETIAGRRIARARIRRRTFVRHGARSLGRTLTGAEVAAVEREGKRLWLRLAGGADCLIHLGMSGRVTLERPGAETPPHTHLTLAFEAPEIELRLSDPRRFGGIWCFPRGRATANGLLSPLGPDALSISARTLTNVCRGRRPVKALLLDQRALAGLGNIYADEALFDALIHPLTPAEMLSADDCRRLATSVRRVLRKAVAYGGSTLRDFVRADGSMGEFQKIHRVYGRASQPCVRCATPIERTIVAQRSTHFCPRCQP